MTPQSKILVDHVGFAALEAARAHARAMYPKESCGLIVDRAYRPCFNYAANPLEDFSLADLDFQEAAATGKLQAVVHSHPDGPIFPNAKDMRSQIATDVPWVIVTLNEDQFGPVTAWGDGLPIVDVIARPFIHGVFDCYSILRDTFRLGRDKLAAQGVEWPLEPILLPEVPRNDNWWAEGDDLYAQHFEQFGFKTINVGEARPGDVFLMDLSHRNHNPEGRLNHAGMLVGGGDQVLHHLPTRLSVRQPASMWARAADLWIRYDP